jgi:glycosyltransferase involved in cell wall biosynthesis
MEGAEVSFAAERDEGERAKSTATVDRSLATGSFSLSLVVPMLDEEAACGPFFETVVPILETITDRYEIVCVDDGSSDRTATIIAAYRKRNPRIKLVGLSRNFGKEAALTAGLDHATGDAVIPIDVDLQDPPEVIPLLVEQWRRGCDTVIAVRESRDGDTFLKRATARMFYRLLDRISEVPVVPEAGDFRLLDRKLVSILRDLPERSRFMKGMYAWAGFKQGRGSVSSASPLRWNHEVPLLEALEFRARWAVLVFYVTAAHLDLHRNQCRRHRVFVRQLHSTSNAHPRCGPPRLCIGVHCGAIPRRNQSDWTRRPRRISGPRFYGSQTPSDLRR